MTSGNHFAIGGRRAYLVGRLDGTFPDTGNHLPGEMGGLWALPIKVADGLWFGLSPASEPQATRWMCSPSCISSTLDRGMARREFALEVGGPVHVVQELFVPRDQPALLITLTLTNRSGHPL